MGHREKYQAVITNKLIFYILNFIISGRKKYKIKTELSTKIDLKLL